MARSTEPFLITHARLTIFRDIVSGIARFNQLSVRLHSYSEVIGF